MTNVERIDHINDELEIVKQLLISSASYAESANQRIDRLIERQDVTQGQLDSLTASVQVMSETTQRRLEGLAVSVQVMGEITQRQLENLAVSVQVMSEMTQRQLDSLTASVQVMSQKIDGFIDSTSNFIDTNQARNAVLDSAVLELRDNQQSTDAARARLEIILEQLLRSNDAAES